MDSLLPGLLAVLQRILAPKGGFMGMVGERGIGGSKCGSTAALAMVYKTKVGGLVWSGGVAPSAWEGCQPASQPSLHHSCCRCCPVFVPA